MSSDDDNELSVDENTVHNGDNLQYSADNRAPLPKPSCRKQDATSMSSNTSHSGRRKKQDSVSEVFISKPIHRSSGSMHSECNSSKRRKGGDMEQISSCNSGRKVQNSGQNSSDTQIPWSPDPVDVVRQMEEDEQYARMLQDSPDPVEQVRQVEEDEIYARMLERSEPIESLRQVQEDEIYARMLESEEAQRRITDTEEEEHNEASDLNCGESEGHIDSECESFCASESPERCDDHSHGESDSTDCDQSEHIDSNGPDDESSGYRDLSDLEDYEDDPIEVLDVDLDDYNDTSRGLCESEIRRLPTREYFCPTQDASANQSDEENCCKKTENNKECQICMNELQNYDILRILPCFHEFHCFCIDPWLRINGSCPVCRIEVSFEDQQSGMEELCC